MCTLVSQLFAFLLPSGRDGKQAGVIYPSHYRVPLVQEYSPEIDKRFRPHLRLTNDSWRVDETYILVKGKQKYLGCAVDSQGNTLDFLLTAKRDALAAKRFFCKTLKAIHTQTPRVINVDKNPAYPKAIKELKAAKQLPEIVKLRQIKYLNNIVEQNH